MPLTNRIIVNRISVGAMVVRTAVIANSTPVNRSARGRQTRSESGPANRAPTAEPSRIDATAKPVPAPDDWKVAWMPGTAPLMTALSNPNRNPPIAADAAITTTNPVLIREAGWTGTAAAVMALSLSLVSAAERPLLLLA